MHWSRLFIPTLREDPAGVEPASLRLLMRAGYMRPLDAQLFLGQRCARKITAIVHKEMSRLGAQEMRNAAGDLPVLGRELRSYKQLPQVWYQIRDGTLESYSFDLTASDRDAAGERYREAFALIFARCGLQVNASHFMVESNAGHDVLVVCPGCGEAASLNGARLRAQVPMAADPEGPLEREAFHTPGCKTIAEVAEFTGLPETSQMKSLVMNADGAPVLALLRGDHQLSNEKLSEALGGVATLRPATAAEIQKWFGATAGSLGPVGVKGVRVLADEALRGRRNMISGANRDDYHLRNVTPGKDFTAEFCDLREAVAGDGCVKCGAAVEVRKATQLAQIEKLGRKYAESSGLRVVDPSGKEVAPFLGSCRLWTERIPGSVVEQNHDKDGMILPPSIAPFTVVVTPVNFADEQQRSAAEAIYQACLDRDTDALLDDREERPGVKFKDADLIGIPWRVVVGKKVPHGLVELVDRRSKKPVEMEIGKVAAYLADPVVLAN